MITVKDVLLIVIGTTVGIFTEAFVGTPVKYLVNGDWKRKRKLKRRAIIKDEIYDKIRECKSENLNTQYFYDIYKNEIDSVLEMYNLIKELVDDGRLRMLKADGVLMGNQIWIVNL